MRIKTIRIQNFRKLRDVSIELQPCKTVFIGANNSGKTTAMTAICYFLGSNAGKRFSIYEFSLTEHQEIKEIGKKLENGDDIEDHTTLWENILPSLDIWFDVGDDDIHYVSHILPTLDWTGGEVGVRLCYEPKDIAEFHSAYKKARENAKELQENGNDVLFPQNMLVFLESEKILSKYFNLYYYLLDPKKEQQQSFTSDKRIADNPLSNLIKISEINAQRDVGEETESIAARDKQRLSRLVTEYYSSHLDPAKNPTKEDVEALKAEERAQESFAKNIRKQFEPILRELNQLGYPGFYNPNIDISPLIRPVDSLKHDSALQYEIGGCKGAFLPETYNGLGYKNLIFIFFKLISHRDSWLKIGKQKEENTTDANNIEYPPIHLVLIEEPEAHLHPQAQQVFIKQAYDFLTSKKEIEDGGLATQLIVSTHSSHITHECDFSDLRYFKRNITEKDIMPSSTVVNLSSIFGGDKDTERFVTRYIKLMHCDLFFADAIILIEGDAERILMPQFIQKSEPLKQAYISLLNIGGNHAHRLKPLIKKLEIPTLIITDLDAAASDKKAVLPKRESQQITSNPTLREWLSHKEIDGLLNLQAKEKQSETPFPLCFAFQTPIGSEGEEIIPSTFEDALIFEPVNKNIIDNVEDASPMIRKAQKITKDPKTAFDLIRDSGFKKAEFALDLLSLPDFEKLKTPQYIKEALDWLEAVLQRKLTLNPSHKESVEIADAER